MDSFRRLAGLKTLLIDDNEIVRDTLTMVFAFNKCFIEAVATAEEGLRALEGGSFDIIICDFRLPGINGVEFFQQVVKSHPDTVRVLISGYGKEETIAEASEVGIHEFMIKPFSLAAFLKQLMPHVDQYLAAKYHHPIATPKKAVFKDKTTKKPPGIKEDLPTCWPNPGQA